MEKAESLRPANGVSIHRRGGGPKRMYSQIHPSECIGQIQSAPTMDGSLSLTTIMANSPSPVIKQ